MDLTLILNSLIYSVVGTVVLVASFFIFDKLTPYDLWAEICREKNVALAIVVGAMALGISIIIASAVHG